MGVGISGGGWEKFQKVTINGGPLFGTQEYVTTLLEHINKLCRIFEKRTVEGS